MDTREKIQDLMLQRGVDEFEAYLKDEDLGKPKPNDIKELSAHRNPQGFAGELLLQQRKKLYADRRVSKEKIKDSDSVKEFMQKSRVNHFTSTTKYNVDDMNALIHGLLKHSSKATTREYEALRQSLKYVEICKRQQMEQKDIWKKAQKFNHAVEHLAYGIKAKGTHDAKAYHLAKVLMLTESKDRFLDCLKRLQEEKGNFDSTNETSSKNWRNIF